MIQSKQSFLKRILFCTRTERVLQVSNASQGIEVLDLATGRGAADPLLHRGPTAGSFARWKVVRDASANASPHIPSNPDAHRASTRGAQRKPSHTPATSAWGAAHPLQGPRKTRCLFVFQFDVTNNYYHNDPRFTRILIYSNC